MGLEKVLTKMTNFRDVADEPSGGGRGAVTITDVANAAGVSASTVSYVITGKRTISPATRRRVEETIRALGYRRRGGSPSPRAGVLAVAVPPLGDRQLGTEMEFFSAAAGAARELGFDLLLVTDDDGTSGLHRVTSAALADAVIVLDAGDEDPRVPVLLASGRPAVLVGAPGQYRGLASVTLDFAPAGRACLTHLADLGHRSVAHLGPSATLPGHRLRYLQGFGESFLTAAGERGVKAVSRPCAPAAEDVARCLDELLADGGPTGLVVHDEAALPLVMGTLRHRGRQVPGDVSVVAVCSDTVAGQQRIRPTAVVMPAAELGVLAVRRAVGQLDGEPAGPDTVAPAFVTGESTAAAPAALSEA
ncbi:LacI family transcriptional regulator [Amycolatopsis mediterranei S699]|uniref:LacI family transcriptional regulator n=2 Tax=Amycolatopsis mediterranei TaxID=33910 RepID=A0A0H3D220_AMYMU|nr:LacI family DNA-binding transcriptional regulator [Amycolatopsis mediterranei]ADJ44989.1 LacI family transcriptional regulator [Amycolatopsis mediterranei U32]AEK41740.1 LacI family transcriptional regulator [Amycolatopsis mediterranei S699]AFO76700.1 LacI family transcriptional regulator [Amycolatopsis mediterranei S699]AGT83828.1 LacI family transcriptional regulator [Amycolatopsis mediterranei RB]KDO07186.1 LacI family transcriptional regulator [Amycolatopsis mediterranei]